MAINMSERPCVHMASEARSARQSVTQFLGEFEHDEGWLAAWRPVREKIGELRESGRLTREEANTLDEQAFWACCKASIVVADRVYDSIARAYFPEALRQEAARGRGELDK